VSGLTRFGLAFVSLIFFVRILFTHGAQNIDCCSIFAGDKAVAKTEEVLEKAEEKGNEGAQAAAETAETYADKAKKGVEEAVEKTKEAIKA